MPRSPIIHLQNAAKNRIGRGLPCYHPRHFMYLKRLELQGFKTFANRTEVDFSGGMTAVVGPNGSGKSNVADAIRWVLGEQSLRALRCKKTEDVVFAGGAGRPPAGLAEVSITFDNTTGWLDTPFQEVVVTRRAHRSGENEYFLNRDRVRLRDVLDLLLKANVSPNGYTVIGQGMVDMALSLKPEERRELFEDAAGIRHHYVRLNEARNRLATTETNLSRVRDVIVEIEPRLKVLERRARQLRERDSVRADLRAHLAAWYGHRWLELRAEADAAEAREREAAATLATARTTAEQTSEQAGEIVARQTALRARLDEVERERTNLASQAERLERERALRLERATAARSRAEELRQEVSQLRASASADEEAVVAARGQLARLDADVAGLNSELAAAQDVDEQRRQRAATLRTQLLQAQSVAMRLQQEQGTIRGEIEKIATRRTELEQETARQREAAARDEEQIATARAAVEAAQAALDAAQADVAEHDGAVEHLRAELTACRQQQEAVATRIAEMARERATVQGRIDLLTDAREGFAGYYQGVRAVLAAAKGDRGPRLDGIVGLVASLVRVPVALEMGIEVALGGHLQDIVVERWEHAEAAVEMLKRTKAGRATFLPLDTIRGRSGADEAARVAGPGVRGVASALVDFDERYRSIVEHLLGRTLIVDDLAVARGVLRQIGGSWQIVTTGAELVRSSGAITGGAGQGGDRTLLARERERRELPERLAAIVASGRSLEQDLSSQRALQAEQETALRAAQDGRRAAEQAVARAREILATATTRAERLRREIEWSRELGDRALAELAELDQRETKARARLNGLPRGAEQYEELIGALEARLLALEAATREQSSRLAGFRNSVAVIEGERRAQTRLLESHSHRRERVAAEIGAREHRVDELTGSAATLIGEAEELEAARGALEDQRAALLAEAKPIQDEIAGLAERARLIQAGESAARAHLNELSDAVRTEAIAAQSARDRIVTLVRSALVEMDDLRPDALEPAPLAEGDGQDEARDEVEVQLEIANEPIELDVDPTTRPADFVYEPLTSPEATWRRVESLRGRLRTIGAVDASAGHEYDETFARHAFLSGQAADLIDASRLLKEAIVELETTMQTRFEQTFEAVAAAFKRHFTALFGGGTARLVLAESENGAVPGVEIIAQPPGKRAQNLSLLSGGERALTAVAILFAILEVNPTPVCILDEVDAALDDANIVRFGQTLRHLSQRTQFVVITHNRGTMESADALYGISMIDRSTSRTVSLKLADIPA